MELMFSRALQSVPYPFPAPGLPVAAAPALVPKDREAFERMSEADRAYELYLRQTDQANMLANSFNMLTQMFSCFMSMSQRIENPEKTISANKGLSVENLAQTVADIIEEHGRIAEKKNNLVLYGLEEETPEGYDDKENVRNIFERCGANPDSVQDVQRMGKKDDTKRWPRLVKIFTTDHTAKVKVRDGHRDIFKTMDIFKDKPYSTYLRDDWTDGQRAKRNEKVNERNEKNRTHADPGTTWIVTRNFEVKCVKKFFNQNQQQAN